MADYEIQGTVIERGTQRGVQGLVVEAWDRDTRFHDMLGSTVTDGAGRFRIRFTDEYFGDYTQVDREPDVFYRVFRDEALVLSTQDNPTVDQRGPLIRVTLELEPLVEPRVRNDRVDADTAIKALTFFRTSDFRGVGREAEDRVRLGGGLLGTMLMNGFKEWNWEPIRATRFSNSEVVNQNTQTAQANLAAQNVTVDRVEPFNPALSRQSAQLLTANTRLEPGERVVLYEEDGRVKYYAKVKEQPTSTIDQQQVGQLSNEVAGLRAEVRNTSALRTELETDRANTRAADDAKTREIASLREQVELIAQLRQDLATMRTDLTARNQTIAGLQAELVSVKASQERIERTDLTQRLDRLEAERLR